MIYSISLLISLFEMNFSQIFYFLCYVAIAKHSPSCSRARKNATNDVPVYVESADPNFLRKKKNFILSMCSTEKNKTIVLLLKNDLSFDDLPTLIEHFSCDHCKTLAMLVYEHDGAAIATLIDSVYHPIQKIISQGIQINSSEDLHQFCMNVALHMNLDVFGSSAIPEFPNVPLPNDLDLVGSYGDYQKLRKIFESLFSVRSIKRREGYAYKHRVLQIKYGSFVLSIDFMNRPTFEKMPNDFLATNMVLSLVNGKRVLTTRGNYDIAKCLIDASQLKLRWILPEPVHPTEWYAMVKTAKR